MFIKILAFLAALIPLILFILKRRPKSAEEVLPETPTIDSVKEQAERNAEQKFGPRK